MMDPIPIEDFLTIFVSGALVIIFGAGYVTVFTIVKMQRVAQSYMSFAYLFWAIQTYSLYILALSVRSDLFTQKILVVAMVGYLYVPHFIYFLLERTHVAFEHD